MDDFCDCSQCPHHCGEDKEEVLPTDDNEKNAVTATPSGDSSETSDAKDASSLAEASANEKVAKLKKAIQALGFKLKDTKDGIRVMM